MQAQAVLEDAVTFATSLIEGPGNNPAFFQKWRDTRVEWQGYLDRGEYRRGAEAAFERVRVVFVSASDSAEATADLSGLSPFDALASKLGRKLTKWETLLPDIRRTR